MGFDTVAFDTVAFDYAGSSSSTLCVGCGHDSITSAIIQALELDQRDPTQIVKASGIGCSSKTPAYFSKHSFGINFIHGRMAPLATGIHLANPELKIIGISGDGDSGSIGLGSFLHMARRNLPIVYLVENNGVYGLTKGQNSATLPKDAPSKSGAHQPFPEIDLAEHAILAGATFVARSFSGDAKQLVPLIRAAMNHPGTAIIDILSPCVTYQNYPGAAWSFESIRKSKQPMQDLGLIEEKDTIEITLDQMDQRQVVIELHNGEQLVLNRKHDTIGVDDLTDPFSALTAIRESQKRGQLLTGLLHLNPSTPNLCHHLNLSTDRAKSMQAPRHWSAESLEQLSRSFR